MDHDATIDRRTLLRTGAGATAAAAGGVAATGSAAAQEQQIDVGPEGDSLSFSPDSVTIAPGTTVTFVWGTGGHNVAVESQPDGANWEGHETIEDAGYEFSHTFETEGTYDYVCEPHVSSDMTGTIEVAEGGGGGGGGATGPPEVPAAAMSLTTGIIGALLAICAATFYFIKYGGTDEE